MTLDSLFSIYRYRRNNARRECGSACVASPSAKMFPCLALDEGLVRCKRSDANDY
ncbi:MAG: hypothetical protein GPOALKHO_000157 [Sodalis sp.]|nr:MAG: hypothetical protein GPOALKHO_000157 [Sodalis sp.]